MKKIFIQELIKKISSFPKDRESKKGSIPSKMRVRLSPKITARDSY